MRKTYTAKVLTQETWNAVVFTTQAFHSFTDCLPASPYYLDWADSVISKNRGTVFEPEFTTITITFKSTSKYKYTFYVYGMKHPKLNLMFRSTCKTKLKWSLVVKTKYPLLK